MSGNGHADERYILDLERGGWVRETLPKRAKPTQWQKATGVFHRDKRTVFFGPDSEFVSTCANSARADTAVKLLNRIAQLDEITLSVVSRGVQVLRGQNEGFMRFALVAQDWIRDLAGAILDSETTPENLLDILHAWAVMVCKAGPDGIPYERAAIVERPDGQGA